MSFTRVRNALFVGVTAVAVAAMTVAVAFALGGGTQPAGAVPRSLPKGTLGIGIHVVAPIDGPLSMDAKIPGADAGSKPASMLKAAKRKDAPVPKPKPVVKAASSKRSSGSSSSRAASGSGWQSAKVSWYGPGFYGNTMAGGGTLHPDSMVVAHRSLAFGTRIQFSYNGRTCTAVVMDRGPYVGGRVFDLGPGTAKALGFSGVGTVKYRVLGR